ncbi:uncharacterized protein [Lolium perenne]|uniref:uncharacterized protein n=1 Tax=Lolium perenne TaxID=4522 RepID=UPI003A9919E9
MQERVVRHFWKYFTRAEGKEIACDVILHELCRVRVTGMHYEARVQCVRDWHAERKVWMSKADCRDTLMAPWQYLQNPPQYVGEDKACFLAMVIWWTSAEYARKHEEGKQKRLEMGGGSHVLGSKNLALTLQQEEVKTGVTPNLFGLFQKSKTRREPHPETGSVWVNGLAEAQCGAYRSKFKDKHGEDADPTTEDFDVEVAVLAGQGKKGGRLWIADGLVDPTTIPSLRQIRRGRTSEQPRVETRPRASDLAVEKLRAEMEERERRHQEEQMQMQQQLRENMQMQQQMLQQMQQQQQMFQQMFMNQTVLTSPPGSSGPSTSCPPMFPHFIPTPDPAVMALLQQGPSQSPLTPGLTVNNTGIIRSLQQFLDLRLQLMLRDMHVQVAWPADWPQRECSRLSLQMHALYFSLRSEG